MKIPLSRLDKKIIFVIRQAGALADKMNLPACAVGGIVRDLLLKRKSGDLDIVVEGDAIDFANHLGKKMRATVVAYEKFKTATLILPGGFKFDVVTARKESYPSPGALPVVEKGTLKDDLFRRDFTINALAAVINKKRFGEVVDHFGGLDDLRAKKIRVLHGESFSDDPTRILRAVRFEQRFGFSIEEKTLGLLKTAVQSGAVSSVKPPRYFMEFKKNLEEKQPKRSLLRLFELGGLSFLSPQIAFDDETSGLFDAIDWTAGWFCKKFPKENNVEFWLVYFMALVRNISFDALREMLERFHLAKEASASVILSEFAPRTVKKLSAKLRPHEVYNILKPLSFETILFLHACANARRARKNIEDFLLRYSTVKLSVSGKDLKRLGVLPGRPMGVILEEILEEKVDGNLRSKRDEVNLAQRLKAMAR